MAKFAHDGEELLNYLTFEDGRLVVSQRDDHPGLAVIDLTPKAAVNLASALLQWSTQNREATPPPPPATPAVLPRKERGLR